MGSIERRNFARDLRLALAAPGKSAPIWAALFMFGLVLTGAGSATALVSILLSYPRLTLGVLLAAIGCPFLLGGLYLWKTKPTWPGPPDAKTR